MDIRQKLQSYKEKINNYAILDKDFEELIVVELYNFIHKNKILQEAFYYHFDYFKRLSQDKSFIKIEDKLFQTIIKIANLTNEEEIGELYKKLKMENPPRGRIINRLKKVRQEDMSKPPQLQSIFIELPELYKNIQNKKNYYQLEDKNGVTSKEDFLFTKTYGYIKQFQFVESIFDNVLAAYLFGEDKNTIQEYRRLAKEYNQIWSKFDEMVSQTPIILHLRAFEDFFLFCIERHQRVGYEIFHSFYVQDSTRKPEELEKVKNFCSTVIDDLIEYLDTKQDDYNELLNKLTSDDFADLKKILDAIEYRFYRKEGEDMEDYFDIERFGEIKKHQVFKLMNMLDKDFQVLTSMERGNNKAFSIRFFGERNLSKFREFKSLFDDRYKNMQIKNLVNTAEEKKPADTKSKKVVFDYHPYDIPSGKLIIGEWPEIHFLKIPAKIVNFFHSNKNVGNDYKNYKDFNDSANESITSDEFNKKIVVINNRVKQTTKGFIKEIIIKGKNKKQEANIYKWNEKFI